MEIFKQKNLEKKSNSLNLIGVSLCFSAIYWILEAVRDVIIFERGSILDRIFRPDIMSLWMRILVICIIILFGVYAQSLKIKLISRQIKHEKFKTQTVSVMAVGLMFGAIYWILEAVRDTFVFNKGDLIDRIFFPDTMGFWMRLLAVFVILLFSVYVQNLVNERREAEEALKRAHDRLEKLIGERTIELSDSNIQLIEEVAERTRVEQELRKVNRALKTITLCNEVMVRADEEKALLDNICETIVRFGEYDLVWVGFYNQNGKESFMPVSTAAHENISIDDIDFSSEAFMIENWPIGRAIKSGSPCVINDLVRSNDSKVWSDKWLKHGFKAMMSLPLIQLDRTFGTLNIFSLDTNAFDDEEVRLLKELADDLAFGLHVLRTRADQKKAEAEKEKIQVQLLHSQKMEAVGVLAGGVAHDFNNMLTAIQVSTDLAMMQIAESDPIYLELKEIHRVAISAAELSKQLLLFSRKHPMEYTAINLNDSIGNLNKMLRRLIGEEVNVETKLTDDLWTVWGDKGTIEQVIMNLTINAKDAMPNGGQVVIETENIKLDKSNSKAMPESRHGKFVRLTFKDTGIGMDKETVGHIFEPFFSTKGPGKGTGLGLSVVYGIVKEHKGWINVNSELGNGTLFEIYLPAVYVQVEEEIAEATDYSLLKGNGERILMIEDENRVREFTSRGLFQNNYKVFPAASAAEALELFEKEDGKFDLIFSDVVLPDLNGIELADKFLEINPKLRILLSSGYVDHKSQIPSAKERGLHYLQKPYALPDLLRMIKTVAS
ncbi:GAF domain-containing protein [candidate division KSB1 bacterium]|nr:GAF domain-containing protein [candidate division KSB1 bacterium]